MTYGHAVDFPHADDPSSPPGPGAGGASELACLWESLPNDTLAGIASYLSLRERIRLSETDRRTRHTLLPQLNPVRLEWMISRVSNVSTFRAALAEIDRQRLRPADRVRALDALFDSIDCVPGELRTHPWRELVDAVGGLPAPVRGSLLRRIVETVPPWPPGWRNLPASADPDMVSARLWYDRTLWHMIEQQPGREPIFLLVIVVESMEPDDFVGVDLDHWIARAIALPEGHRPVAEAASDSITYRGKLLQALLRGADECGAVCDEAGFRRFMAASERLQMPEGRPSTQERSALLAALASVLVACPQLGRDDSGRVWDELVDAACRLPPEDAAPVLLRLSNWFALTRHSGDVVRAQRLWKAARQMDGGDIILRSRWLAALGSYIADRSQVWQTLWNEWRASAQPDKHEAAVALGRAAVQFPALPDGTPAWSAVLNGTVALPLECRGAVLAGLVQGLRDSEADPHDPRWTALVDAAAPLSATAQLPLLAECIEHDPVLLRYHWPRYAAQLAALPADELGEALPFALYLTREFDYDDADRAWWTLAALMYRMPAHTLREPWRALFRVIHSLYYDEEDEEQLAQVRDFMQGPLGTLAPIAQRDLLIEAITDLQPPAYAAHFHWLLDQASALRSALRAPVVARLALLAPVMVSADELVPLWGDLVDATAGLPAGYRGAPLNSMVRLYERLPADHQKAALPALLALCAGVPAVDLPGAMGRDQASQR